MKQSKKIDKSTLRWLGILLICVVAIALYIGLEYQTIIQTIDEEKVSDSFLGGLLTKTLIAISLMTMILALAWQQNSASTSISTKPKQLDNWLHENLPFGVAIWCEQGNLIDCNSTYRSKLGFSFNDTKSGSDYVSMIKKIKSKHDFKIVSDEELIRQIEITSKDGTNCLLDERPLKNGGFITLIFDITEKVKAHSNVKKMQNERRNLNKQLQAQKIKAKAASQAKTSFLAHLSHDVRTPLTHIIGFSEVLSQQDFEKINAKRYLDYVNNIKTSGENLLASFSKILELVQLEGGDLILKPEEVELDCIMKTALLRHNDSAKRAGIKLEINTPDNIMLKADKISLERMISNIVENSIRFTQSGGLIKINSWLAQDGVVFEITDTGIGISAERLKDLDQPFVLGDAAFTKEGGVGVGLAISRAIAHLNGGDLAIDSRPAIGTTVVISLPAIISLKTEQKNIA